MIENSEPQSSELKIVNSRLILNSSKLVESVVFLYTIFVFVTFTSAFKLFGLLPHSAGLVYLGGLVLIFCRARILLSRPGILLIAMLFPMFALVSAFWGDDPATTIRHSVQLCFTALLAASIGCSLPPHKLMVAMSVAFGGLIFLSVANLWLQIVPAFQQKSYLQGNEYFTGIFAHKNTLGNVLCLTALCLSYFVVKATLRWPFVVLLLALLPILLFARSTTSVVLYALILTIPFVYVFFRLQGRRLLIAAGLACIALLIVIVLELNALSLIDIGLEMAGKGRDMSGRTHLWSIALERFSERPWLGVGYQSFWTTPQYQEDVVWVSGFLEQGIKHFHNAWLEALVGLGLIGLVSMAIVPISLVCLLAPRLVGNDCTAIDVIGVYLSILILIRANVEASLYFQHESGSVALICLLFSILLVPKRVCQ